MYSLRALKSLLCRRVLALLALILTSAWISGLSDHLYEISFREFKWPPYEIDVLAETSRAMAGEPPRFLVLNNWNLFHSIREPECRMWNQTLQLLIIVKSASFNKKAREAIRQTWGMRESSGAVEIVFVVGKPEDADVATKRSYLMK
ncbi:hypothetical protein KIN20_018349 [Parelaphostrongylus tenuis]|uniref:Hexosyltransferase n=1 Tax=Parelaphostrongylus tenuis TaxID=148309 RepID=A0AAD5N444_PARTN|nr:hypothetical protein KIN20_018349 [Parelaphostrongylus tenuis]